MNGAPTYQYIKRAVAVIGFAVNATDLEQRMMASVGSVIRESCLASFSGVTLKTMGADAWLSGCC